MFQPEQRLAKILPVCGMNVGELIEQTNAGQRVWAGTHRQQRPQDAPAQHCTQHHGPGDHMGHQHASTDVLLLEVKVPRPLQSLDAKCGQHRKAAAVVGTLKQPVCSMAAGLC